MDSSFFNCISTSCCWRVRFLSLLLFSVTSSYFSKTSLVTSTSIVLVTSEFNLLSNRKSMGTASRCEQSTLCVLAKNIFIKSFKVIKSNFRRFWVSRKWRVLLISYSCSLVIFSDEIFINNLSTSFCCFVFHSGPQCSYTLCQLFTTWQSYLFWIAKKICRCFISFLHGCSRCSQLISYLAIWFQRQNFCANSIFSPFKPSIFYSLIYPSVNPVI